MEKKNSAYALCRSIAGTLLVLVLLAGLGLSVSIDAPNIAPFWPHLCLVSVTAVLLFGLWQGGELHRRGPHQSLALGLGLLLLWELLLLLPQLSLPALTASPIDSADWMWRLHLLLGLLLLVVVWSTHSPIPARLLLLLGVPGLGLAYASMATPLLSRVQLWGDTGLLLVVLSLLYIWRRELKRHALAYFALTAALLLMAGWRLLELAAVPTSAMLQAGLLESAALYLLTLAVVPQGGKGFSLLHGDGNDYDAIPLPLLLVDSRGLIRQANQAALQVAGMSAGEILGEGCHRLFHPQQEGREQCPLCQAMATKQGLKRFELHDEGRARWWSYSLTPIVFNDGEAGMIHLLDDITERREMQEALLHETNFDHLTRLANRRLATDRLEQAVKRARLNAEQLLCVFVDLDNFKLINDSLGHEFGDKVLIHVARILQQLSQGIGSLARWGGDEFLLILPNFQGTSKAESLASRLLTTLAEPCIIDGRELLLRCSIGMSIYPEHGQSAEKLLSYADSALHMAKEAGRNTYRFFDAQSNAEVQRRMELESRLGEALERGEFSIHYQPKVDIVRHEVCGMEALIRWHSQELGLVPTAEFIPIAEESGQIIPIGHWLIEQCREDLLRLKQQGLEGFRLALNISARQLEEEGFVERLRSRFSGAGLRPAEVELEITEGLLLDVSEANMDTLYRLQKAGFGLALDDYGTGYSAISYLKNFPFSSIKIDRSYIRDIETDEADARLCAAIIALAGQLGLGVVAEGVETEAQVEYLYEHGARIVQGNYFSRPLAFEAFVGYVRKYL